MLDEIFIGNLFLPRMAGKIAKIRTRKNFVPHGNLQFCLSFVIFLILMTKNRKTWHFNDKSQTKVRNSPMLISLSLFEFRVF